MHDLTEWGGKTDTVS